MAKTQELPPLDRMLSTRETLAVVPLSLSSIYQGMAAGWFPRNVRLSPKRVAWRESDIRAFLASRQSYRKQSEPKRLAA